MREGIHVDPDNPTQYHLLPNERAPAEFAAWSSPFKEIRHALFQVFLPVVAMVFPALMFGTHFPDISNFRAETYGVRLFLAVLVALALSVPMIREYARFSSLLPCPRKAAMAFREKQEGLMWTTLILFAVAALFICSLGLDFLILLPFGIVCATITLLNIGVVGDCIRHWFAYNLTGPQQVPGIYDPPIGRSVRHFLFGFASFVIALLFFVDSMMFPVAVHPLAPAYHPFYVIFGTLGVVLAITGRRAEQFRESWRAFSEIAAADNQVRRDHEESRAARLHHHVIGRFVNGGPPAFLVDVHLREHLFVVGRPGVGKTLRALRKLIYWSVRNPDRISIVADFKADTNEIPAIVLEAVEQHFRETGVRKKVYTFTLDVGKASHGFNPVQQRFFREADSQGKADFLTKALGVSLEGAAGDAAYYAGQDANALEYAYNTRPDAGAILETADFLERLTREKNNRGLHETQKKSSQHVVALMRRLAGFDVLNRDKTADDIDLDVAFREPCVIILSLNSLRHGFSAGLIGRLWMWSAVQAMMLIDPKDRIPCDFIIDEATVALDHSTQDLLNKSRSVWISFTLALQNLSDLPDRPARIASTLESTCGVQWWLSVTDPDQVERMCKGSGTAIDYIRTVSSGGLGDTRWSSSEFISQRLTTNDISKASADPDTSIIRILKNEGFAQYGGFAFVAETPFETGREYAERLHLAPWPALPGTALNRPMPPRGGPQDGHAAPVLPPPVEPQPIAPPQVIGGKKKHRKR